LGSKRKDLREQRRNCITRSFVICINPRNQGEGRVKGTEIREMHTGFWWRNFKESDLFENLDVEGKDKMDHK
jgi:hypothetical protein